MINIDMWHNDKIKAVEKINIFFNDLTGEYWGNCYINNKAIGDYTADSSTDIEKTFEHLAINWNSTRCARFYNLGKVNFSRV